MVRLNTSATDMQFCSLTHRGRHSQSNALPTDAHTACVVDELADMTEDGRRLTMLSASQQLDALLLAHSQTLEPSLRSSLEASSSGVPELSTAANGPAVDSDYTATGKCVSHAAICRDTSFFAHSIIMTASSRDWFSSQIRILVQKLVTGALPDST